MDDAAVWVGELVVLALRMVVIVAQHPVAMAPKPVALEKQEFRVFPVVRVIPELHQRALG
jgi:hypothetical protein